MSFLKTIKFVLKKILLMCDANECEKVINSCPENVKLLIDVAHLKVSSNYL